MIRAIAFDWGGIFTRGTFDSHAVENLTAVTRLDAETVAAVYYPLLEEFEVGAFDVGGFIDLFVQGTGTLVDEDRLAATFLASGRERTEMYDILASIPGHYTVGMLSNNVPALCDQVRSDPRMNRIEHFVFSNEIGVRKPDPAAFAALTEAIGVPATETVFIDDNERNVAAARELGFHAILLDTMPHFHEQWRALLPEVEVPEETPA